MCLFTINICEARQDHADREDVYLNAAKTKCVKKGPEPVMHLLDVQFLLEFLNRCLEIIFKIHTSTIRKDKLKK